VVALPDGELRDVIMLAMDTATEETGYHELFHAAERLGVLTAEDLAVLDRRYPAGRKTAGETRADAYGRWKTGDKTNIPPVVARIFQKIREFFERAGNALRGLGYRSAADVFADLDSGKLADPKRRQITRSADLGRRLDADEWINGITVEQAVRMVRDGKGTEVAGHVLEGVKKGNLTIAEAEDTIINAAMADPRFRLRKPELAEAAKKLVAEGIEELRAGIAPETREAANYSLAADPSPAAQAAKRSLKSRALGFVDGWEDFVSGGVGRLGTWYMDSRNETLGTLAMIDRAGEGFRKIFQKAGKDAEAIVAYWTTKDAKTDAIESPEMRLEAEEMKRRIERIGDQAVALGMLPKEVVEAHRGEYLPRVYLQFVLQKMGSKGEAGKAVKGGWTKGRRWDMSEEEAIARGAIHDPAYLASRAYTVPLRDMVIVKWLQEIANRPDMVMEQSFIEFAWEESATERKVGNITYRTNKDGTYDVSVQKQTPKVYTHKVNDSEMDVLLGPKLAEAVRAGKGKALRRKTGTSPRAQRAQYQETGEVRLGHIWYRKGADGAYTVKVREMTDASTDHRGVAADVLAGLVGEKRAAEITTGEGKLVGGRKVTPYWLALEADRIHEQATKYQKGAEKEQALRTEQRMRDLLAEHVPPDYDPKQWHKMPEGRRYGPLAGMIVRKEVYDDIVGSLRIITGEENAIEKLALRLEWANAIWKWLKVPMNIPGGVRNFVNNFVSVGTSGTDWHKMFIPYGKHPSLVVQTLREMRDKGAYYRWGMEQGFSAATFSSVELRRAEVALLRALREQGDTSPWLYMKILGATLYNKTGDWYQNVETFFKLLRFIDNMQNKGMNKKAAARDAHAVLIDYSMVRPEIKTLRRLPLGTPFITYTLKIVPVILRGLINHPAHSLPVFALAYGLPYIIARGMGASDDDYEGLMAQFPGWVEEHGHTYLSPFQKDDGTWDVVDLGYFFPWSAWDASFRAAGRALKDQEVTEVWKSLQALGAGGAPAYDIISVWKTGIDPFTNRPVADEYGTPGEKFRAYFLYGWNMAMPSMINLGGRGALGKAVDALSGTVGSTGRPKSTLTKAGLSLVGINAYNFDPVETSAQNMRNMEREIEDTERAWDRRARNPNTTPEKAADLAEHYSQRIDRIVEKMQDLDERSRSSLSR
jgi:hypothetical protein